MYLFTHVRLSPQWCKTHTTDKTHINHHWRLPVPTGLARLPPDPMTTQFSKFVSNLMMVIFHEDYSLRTLSK